MKTQEQNRIVLEKAIESLPQYELKTDLWSNIRQVLDEEDNDMHENTKGIFREAYSLSEYPCSEGRSASCPG